MRLLPVFAPGEQVLAAVSGGADSVALLLLLDEAARAGRLRIVAAHLNHGIRGVSAEHDQLFVRALCAARDIELIEACADVPLIAAQNGQGIETCARAVRRDFLLRAMYASGCHVIATAHHAGDQAETVLMHLLRGGGIRGAGGIRAREGSFARPLLDAPKAAIYAYLAARGQDYCEDATNFVPDTPRNVLRLNILPQMRALYPGTEAAIGRFAHLAAEADDFLTGAVNAFLKKNARLHPLGKSLAEDQAHPAVLRGALHALTGADMDASSRLLSLYRQPRGALSLKGLRAEKTCGRLYLIDPAARPPDFEAALGDGAGRAGIGFLRISPAPAVPITDDPLRQVLDADALADAVLRFRRADDVMRTLGAPGDKLLSDVMIDKKLARPLRDWQMIVARAKRVLWIPGLVISDEAALTQNTRAAVALTWEREDNRRWMNE